MLGPVLFLIFTNDLDFIIKSFILNFADDTKVFQNISNLSEYSKSQKDIDSLLQCSKDCQMLLNID